MEDRTSELRAAGMSRTFKELAEPRKGIGGPGPARLLRFWEGLWSWFLELWEPIAGFTIGADVTGGRTDWKNKNGYGGPEQRHLCSYPGKWGHLI